MRYPNSIQPGDTIGFVAPAFGCNIEPYKSGFGNFQKRLLDEGYRVQIGPNCYEGSGVGISNTPQACGEELTKYYCSGDNNMLISCGGGELMCETISYVDFEKINRAPAKWYTGYSDNTNFTFLLEILCDIASVYGPCAAAYGMEPQHKCLEDAWNVFTGVSTKVSSYDKWEKEGLKDEEHPLVPYNCTEENILRGTSENITMSGRLIGGCMDCLVNLLGTRFDKVGEFLEKYKEDGFIWFLESCDLNVFSIRRAMWQMYEAGWFKYCKGFIFGRPLHMGEEMFGLDQYEAVLPSVRALGVEAVMDADIGHIPPAMPVICGSMAEVNFSNGKLELDMKLI